MCDNNLRQFLFKTQQALHFMTFCRFGRHLLLQKRRKKHSINFRQQLIEKTSKQQARNYFDSDTSHALSSFSFKDFCP